MIVIVKKPGETKDSLFKKFSKETKEENLVFEVSKKLFYKKKSLLKKEKEKDRLKRKAQERKMMTKFQTSNQ